MDSELGPLCFAFETVTSKSHTRLHAILKTKHGDQRYLADSGLGRSGREMIRCLRAVNQSVANAKFARVRDPEVDKQILKMDRDISISHYKFGILYQAEGQIEENLMYCNGT
jgi:hypothetical protein